MFDVIDKSTLKPGDVAETNHRTHVAKCAEKISSSLMALERLQRDGKLFSQDDDFIVKCAERLEQILHEVV